MGVWITSGVCVRSLAGDTLAFFHSNGVSKCDDFKQNLMERGT